MGARPHRRAEQSAVWLSGRSENGRRNRSLLAGVVAGIAHYGNAFGVPTVGGEVSFDDAYALNPLVNAFALGLVRKIKSSLAKPPASAILSCMSAPKPAAMAFTARRWPRPSSTKKLWRKRPTVQVGDPFLEKLLLEACLEAMRSGAVAGIQDMGAAGLTCSTCEMAARGDTGIEIDLSLVPQRETGMTAYEMLLSESQERMLIVAHKGREREVGDIFRSGNLDAVVIGQVRDNGRMRVAHNGEIVCDVPVKALTDEAPVYERPMLRSADIVSASASKARAQTSSESSSDVRADALSADRMSALLPAPDYKQCIVAFCSRHQTSLPKNGSIANTITWCARTRRCCRAQTRPWCESKRRVAL